MDYSEWVREYGVGHPVLDSCHHIFFQAAEQMAEATAPGAAMERMAFLLMYCAMHFGEEEELLHRADYPGLDQHRGIHERFRRRMTILHDELERDPSPQNVRQTAVEMQAWWLQHITVEDRKFARYLKGGE
jgi:hemerythrin